MKIFRSLEEINNIENCACALGNFDGIHIGHRKLIETCVETAKEKGIKSAVFTFTNHPVNEMTGRNMVKTILKFEDKAAILEEMGVDYMFSVPFNEEIRTMSSDTFCRYLLAIKLKIVHAVCGFNYTFGYKAEGDAQMLKDYGKEFGFNVTVIDQIHMGDITVSSTIIRAAIERGAVDNYAEYTGRPYVIEGIVVIGNQLGRTMGFPTVNLSLDDGMALPANGVYLTRTTYNGKVYDSVTNVGNKPTIGKYAKNAETHLFDFREDIYGKPVKVEFIKMQRPERKFENIDALAKQIDQDCITARKLHDELKNKV